MKILKKIMLYILCIVLLVGCTNDNYENKLVYKDNNISCIDYSNKYPANELKNYFICTNNDIVSDPRKIQLLDLSTAMYGDILFPIEYFEFEEKERYIFSRIDSNLYQREETLVGFIEAYGATGIDKKTFISIGSSGFTKDKFRLYRYGIPFNLPVDTFSVEIITDRLIKDKNFVYFDEKVVSGCDSKSFEYLNDDYLRKDKNFVYYYGNILTGIDAKSYIIYYNAYAKDKNNVYFSTSEIISGADPKSFEILGRQRGKDKNHLICRNQVIPGSESNSVQTVETGILLEQGNIGFIKDKNHVYFCSSWNGIMIVSGADSTTFKKIETPSDRPWLFGRYGKDNNYVYRCFEETCAILFGADPKTFTLIGEDRGKDYQKEFFLSSVH